MNERLDAAVTAHKAGRLDQAEAAYRRVLAGQPRNIVALHFLGLIRAQLGDHAEALGHLRKALQVQPKSAQIQADMGEILRRCGDLDAAAGYLSAAVRLTPAYAPAHHNLGLVKLSQERHAEAVDCFAESTKLNPQAADSWHGLGLARQGQWRLREAITAFRQALTVAPRRLDSLCALGGVLFEAGVVKEATAAFRSALALQPTYVPALRGLAEALAETEAPQALKLLSKAIAVDPDNSDLHELMGSVHLRTGEFEAASSSYRRALGLPGKKSLAHYGLAQCKKFTAADDALVQAMLDALNQPGLSAQEESSLQFALGKVMDDQGRYGDAVFHFDRANQLQACTTGRSPPPAFIADQPAYTDDIIRRFDAKAIARLRSVASASERPIFIIGMPRSGTTLVEQILASHPDVIAGGEQRFWTDLMERLKLSETAISLDAARTAVADYSTALDFVSRTAPHVTDKMPHNFIAAGLIQALFPKARIVHCRRRPVDTALSIYFTHLPGHRGYGYDRGRIVTHYRAYQRLMAHWRKILPADRLFEVDYESLVDDPAGVTRAISDFCNLPWDPRLLSFHETTRTVHTASAWQARQPLYRSSKARWRKYEPWLGEFRKLSPKEGGNGTG